MLQIILPAVFVFVIFIVGHFFVSNDGSGLYVAETNFDPETILAEPVEIDPLTIDPDSGLILPDKYNYHKIENVFSGKILGSDKLFSIEVALLTKQSTIASDLFISAIYEMEGDLIAEITKVILEVSADQLLAYDGRENLSIAIQKHINEYLVSKDMNPGITEVFITNFNVV
ncbi:MAG: flagellar basal body-associated FliL family protein [Paracoccaceae bacterium]|jgi:flagellar basal body-associated protein FliL|nr:flagellar basal body-associated FliL family protein [Paracoccaceae bacterium]MDG2249084.1 flagellar basal body-associated FliL family protein [Paracoccaceae bacterium]|tara:strand:- start:1527 stop:2042 length:516 start_codon:yes stop_codon:yes gene_type:complete